MPKKWSPHAWHRRASRPVMGWMVVFIVIGLAHPLVPEPRWLLIHVFTLGILTNSVVLWSQNLTERFLQQRLPDSARPAQLRRTWALNAGVVCVLVGQFLAGWWRGHYALTWVGAAIVAGVLGWHSWQLYAQVRRAGRGKRLRPVVLGYVASAVFLPVGVAFGSALSFGLPGDWQERVRLAHLVTNVGGFVGLAALASLTVLFPSMWRVNGMHDRAGVSVPLAVAGVIVASCGALAGLDLLASAGTVVYIAAWLWTFHGFLVNVLDVLRDPRGRVTYAGLSVFASLIWLIVTLIWFAVRLTTPDLPTLALMLGFAAQLLIGTMSYLLPTTMGGGPRAVRAGLAELSRAAYFRVVLFNGSLACWLATDNSWLRVVMSVLCFGVLVAFLPLMGRAIRAQVGVLKGKDSLIDATPTQHPATQSAAALVVLGVLIAVLS
ncbi:copper oxidase [Corynebacterium gottingense]|uniref:copper oxidase n=1 Tax=Corynebacterium gottingense TaxID=2041036 RepID=UPI0038D1825A